MRYINTVNAALGSLLLLGALSANAATNQHNNASPSANNHWSGQFELGYNSQSGNTNSNTFHSALTLIYNKTLWKNTLTLQADNQYSDRKHIAEEYQGADQLNFNIDKRQYVFGRLNYDKNRFSGYNYQTSLNAGYGYNILTGPVNNLSVEAGAGYTRNQTQANKTESGVSASLSGNYTWHISDLTQFTQNLSINTGAGNNKVHSGTSLETAISGPLHLKLSYLVDYNSKVPTGYKNTDKKLLASLVYKF